MHQPGEMSEVEIAGQRYRIGRLSAIKQFHVSRRIAPIIPTLIPVFMRLKVAGDLRHDFLGMAELVQPFADSIAAMSDEDTEFIFSSCLTNVHRNTGKTWAAIWSAQAHDCMFDDMDLGVLIHLVIRVVQDNLAPFIRGLLTSQEGSPV